MNDDNDKFVWYAAGLHFECLQCGRCCSGPAEGYIWVSKPEIQFIARYLKMSAGELKKKFLKRVGLRRTIIEDARTRDCIFLRQTENGKGCMIYPVRPRQCRTWPFWLGNLSSPDNWNEAARKCPGINRGEVYTPERIKAKGSELWWKRNKEIVERVGQIYKWLDEQLAGKSACDACGKCCDFQSFGHRLFITTPEMLFFVDKLRAGNISSVIPAQAGIQRCPYQVNNKCTVYPHRFAGCRIFSCKANPDFQSDLTESALKKFKALCEKFKILYRYVDLPTALNTCM